MDLEVTDLQIVDEKNNMKKQNKTPLTVPKKQQSAAQSKMMEQLYGERYASQVYERLESLDPELNSIIQQIPYDQFWGRNGLPIRDKALITVAALVALGKEEQTTIHMTGFLNAGGSVDDLRNTLLHLAIYCGFPATMNGFAALKDVLQSRREDPPSDKGKKSK